jgi:hypothetical protein
MRLIDADVLIDELKQSALHHCNNPREDSLLQRDRVIVRAQPTVEAIPKADYENRLKADLVAMLTELKNELIDKSWNIDMYDDNLDFECCYLNDIDKVIQQKINSLKEAKDENEH